MNETPRFRLRAAGVTLVEILVVIVVLAILVALLYPAARSAQTLARRSACVSNLRQIGTAITAYASDNGGEIPYGPKAPPFTNPGDLYPSTGAPTTLISSQSGAPVGLGLLLDRYLGQTPRVLFCPGADQSIDIANEIAKVGHGQVQSSYYYRHAGNTNLFDPGGVAPSPRNIRLFDLGTNSQGNPVRALVMDANFLTMPEMKSFGVSNSTNHDGLWVNVLYSDGHVKTHSNETHEYTVDATSYSSLHSAFGNIVKLFENADAAP